jgi:sulfatase maturation enzyme AslB (radical SAM superfamily)
MSAIVAARVTQPTLDPAKFRDPLVTAKGEARATVSLTALRTLWFNTGTLCNITCAHCYIESSPQNDRLEYLTLADVARFLDEIEALRLPTDEIGLTGGEPFMNPDILAIIEASLERGHRVLVLTNAMRPMMRPRIKTGLLRLKGQFGARLSLRVSLDHADPARHDEERGAGGFAKTLLGLKWLATNAFSVAVAGRTLWGGTETELREGFAHLFAREELPIDAFSAAELVLFPEMDETADVPEITTACWGILKKDPGDLMCASSRMVVKRQGAATPSVVPCTLLPYQEEFGLGPRLEGAQGPVALNHPHCAKFCVLGGGSCTG